MISMSSSASPPRAEAGAADFMRRLSVADAKVLLERTRKEKESKTKEMQKMIGVRYRDLIESADKIVNMHSAALRLEGSLKEMPREWKRVEAALAATLADASRVEAAALQQPTEQHDHTRSSSSSFHTDGLTTARARVELLVEAPEQMWQLLDRGASFRALERYYAAAAVHAAADFDALARRFPFARTAWSCVESFRSRILASAQTHLTCRGQASDFYAQNLCTLAVLAAPTHLSAAQLFDAFLASRTQWMAQSSTDSLSAAQRERHLVVVVRSMNLTVVHAEALFDDASRGFDAFRDAIALAPALERGLVDFATSGALQHALTQWIRTQRDEIHAHVASTLERLPSISQLAHLQATLSRANARDGDCAHSSLWRAIAPAIAAASNETIAATTATATTSNRNDLEHSPFTALFADAFRQRTRDLVQHSFVDALDAITTQIRTVVAAAVRSNSNNSSDRYLATTSSPLDRVAFYDHFDAIRIKAAALDASDLQSVLIEEFLRTLLKLVVFFERTFPLGSHDTSDTSRTSSSSSSQDATTFLCVSNLLTAILAGFATHGSALFPPAANNSNTSMDETATTRGFADVRAAFNASATTDERIDTSDALSAALQRCGLERRALPRFVADELETLAPLGLHAFHLVAEIAQHGSDAQTFVTVVDALARAYCERWARAHVEHEIEPLRLRIRMEQYDASNEEWIASHDGWLEHVIAHDALSDDDDDDHDLRSETSEPSDVVLPYEHDERVWLPWRETSTVSSFLFQCCYLLDDANRVVRRAADATDAHVTRMHATIRDVLLEQVTIVSAHAYREGIALLVDARSRNRNRARTNRNTHTLNFGECCVLQFLFDLYFVRATLGFSDFIRFGWGDDIDAAASSPSLLALLALFAQMRDFVDPVDWEIYGPQLVENVVVQFRKSRLLFSSLSESNDINEINGKQVAVSVQDTRPVVRIAEPVARFSLLPVPSSSRRLQRKPSPTPGRLEAAAAAAATSTAHSRDPAPPRASLLLESRNNNVESSSAASLKLQSILSSSATGSNLLSAAASGTNLLSSAAKGGMSYLSSATSSYLREGESRPKYF